MQTQSIQGQQANKPQAPKSAPLPNNDFQHALTLEMDRMPVCAAPEPAAPAPAQSRAPAKTAQAAKPAQQANSANSANKAQDASQADSAQASASAGETTDSKPAAAATQAGEKDEAGDSTVADPAAGLLAMLAAYGQLTAKPEPATDGLAKGGAETGTDGATLAALQSDVAGKATLADLAADARGKGTTALQDALSEQAGAERMLKADTLADAGAGQKAEDFAAKLAASAAASVADAAPSAQPVVAPAAQALAATVQAANALAANQLQARVGTNAWEQQLGQKVVWMVAGADQSASLTLNPPDLGPLQVVLSVSNDSATATFTAHQAETRQAIENALPKLREMMSEAGIVLGDASVSAGSQEQQQAFAEQAGNGSGSGRYGDGGNGGDMAAHEEGQPVIRRTVLGAVDTFA